MDTVLKRSKQKLEVMNQVLSGKILVSIICLLTLNFVAIVPDLYVQQNDSSISLKVNSGPRITFKRISPGQGLLQNTITCILQDQKGFLWFGTEEGLLKYDGYNFTVYKNTSENPHSLSHDSVQKIYEDRSGILWIGTRGGGLNKFNRETEQFFHYQHNETDSYSLSHNNVYSIYEDRSGVLWIGTDGGGLNRFVRETEQFLHYRHDDNDSRGLSSNFIRTIFEDRFGKLWIGTLGGGLNRFDRKTREFIHYYYDPNNPHSLSHNAVWAIHEDSLGALWIGTYGGGLNRFDRATERFFHYRPDPNDPHSLSHSRVRTIYEDRSGVIWIGTDGGGLNRFDTRSSQGEAEQFSRYQVDPVDPHSLSHNIVSSIYEDQAGILWIGTEGGGIGKFTRKAEQFLHYQIDSKNPDVQVSNVVLSLYEDRLGVLWIGTYGGGLHKYDRETKQLTHYRSNPNNLYSLSSDVVFSIYEDRLGDLWIGTRNGGLNRFDRVTERFFYYQNDPKDPYSLSSNRVRVIYEDRVGTLWIGTEGGGLDRFDRVAERFFHYQYDLSDLHSLSHNDVWSIYEDHLGVLWIGTDGGLNKFDRKTGHFFRYQADPFNPQSLSSNNIRSIHEDQSGVLWIGTRGGGLNKFDRSNKLFTHYGEQNRLPSNVIYGILEDTQGNLWLSTNKYGLSMFDPRTETCENFDVSDGLQSNTFTIGAYHKSLSGEMFFGGINGFNAFYPDNIRRNPHIPSIVITDFQLFNTSVEIRSDSPLQKAITEAEEITLSYKDNVLSFEFAALDYTLPEKNQYAYMMEGVDKDWVYSGTRRFVTYTHLDPGEYVFRVKGSNNDGVWNEGGTSIKIIITPPFWQIWWFRVFIAVLVIGGTLSSFYFRFRAIKVQKRQLEIQVDKRTNDLKKANEQLRQEIAEREQMEIALQHAKEAAESANRAKSEFLANMSHELRTPLNAILGYAQIFSRDKRLTERQKDAVDIVQRSGEHLLSMINDILDLSKIEARKIQLEPTALYLPGFLESIADMVRVRADQKGISFISEIACNIPMVIYGDEKRLRQILLNLLSNAVKFTETGEVIFRAEVCSSQFSEKERSDKSLTTNIRFEVEDTGPGISPENVENIFQPFQQVGGRRFQVQGTGLGLAISQSLARMMDSELYVKSTPGQGSTFWFDVGFPEVVGEDIIPVKAGTEQRKIVGFRGDKRKILIADDNYENRVVLKDILLMVGFEVIEAVDGRDALDKAKTCHPDLILMDLMMPVMDGFEATRQIYKIPELNDVIVIGVSASVFSETREMSLAAGCYDFLTKPVDVEKLLERLQVHLKLEWIYEDQHITQRTPTSSEQQSIILPPIEQLEILYDLIKMGDIASFQGQLKAIEALDPKFRTFVADLRRLAKTFQVNDIRKSLEAYLEEGKK